MIHRHVKIRRHAGEVDPLAQIVLAAFFQALKKYGGFIPGIRPGNNTADYLDHILTRLTVVGAVYMALVCLLPEFLVSSQGVPFQFGGTSLMIVVVVVMDFVSQLNAHMMSHQYPGLLKKANLLGYGRSGAGG